MKTTIIKWNKSMAERCLLRCLGNYTKKANLSKRAKCHKAVETAAASAAAASAAAAPAAAAPAKAAPAKAAPAKASPESKVFISIVKGEWDDFEYALNSVLKKINK